MSATVKLKKPKIINDTASSGGAMSKNDVQNNKSQNIFPHVDESERTSGITRYRKVFLKKEDGVLTNAKFFIDRLSLAGDYFRLKEGTDSDVQSDAVGYDDWAGSGEITEALSGGASKSITAQYDANDGVYDGSKIALVDWDYLVSGAPTIEYLDVESAVFGISGDISDDCSSLEGWTNLDSANGDTTQETFEGSETFKFTVTSAGANQKAEVSRDVGTIGSIYTVEIRTYFDLVGTTGNDDYFLLIFDNGDGQLRARFATNGLFIYNGASYNEAGTDVVDSDTWTVWRFEVDFTTPASATVDIYKDGALVASGVDCSDTTTSNDGQITLSQHGGTINNVLSYVNCIEIADGIPGEGGKCYIYCDTAVISDHSVKTNGVVIGTEDENFDIDEKTLVIKVDGGTEQTITFSGDGKSASEVVDAINAGLSGGTAYVYDTTKVAIRTDSYYTTGSIHVVSASTADDLLGLDNSIHYGTDGTVVSTVIDLDTIESSQSDLEVNSTNGTFNDSTYPIETFDKGTVTDDWTVTFSNATEFGVSGTLTGDVGSGEITEDFSPANWGSYYFKIPKEGWGGTWAQGDSMTFETVNSAKGIWAKEMVPENTEAYFGNRVSFTLDGETA